jgi:hypothetical protein
MTASDVNRVLRPRAGRGEGFRHGFVGFFADYYAGVRVRFALMRAQRGAGNWTVSGKAHISKQTKPLGVKENVFSFQVSVHNATSVHVLNGEYQLSDNEARHVFVVVAAKHSR